MVSPDPAQENPALRANGSQSEKHGERRRRRRALISAPVRVRSLEVTSGGPDEISTTVNVSRVGILFVSSDPAYVRGLSVKVTFPYSSAPTALHAEQDGWIARVFECKDGRRSVAVALGTPGAGDDLVDACGRKLNAPSPVSLESQPQPRKPLVLVVDSDPAVRESLKTYLADQGYESVAVNNSADGRDVLNVFTPALVIAEIEGEDLPGYAICSHVKGTPRLRSIPVVLTTSSAYPSDYSSAHSLGALVCMAKPFKKERLGHIVRLLAPLPHAKAPTAPPHPADPTQKPGTANAPNRARTNASKNASPLWRFRLP